MYDSPIQILTGNINTTFEDGVYKAVQGIGIDVDKKELLKALEYDRDQYRLGYNDGYENGVNDTLKKLVKFINEED